MESDEFKRLLRMDTTGQVCVVLVVMLLATTCWAVDLQAAFKMAQCRAHCLDKVRIEFKLTMITDVLDACPTVLVFDVKAKIRRSEVRG